MAMAFIPIEYLAPVAELLEVVLPNELSPVMEYFKTNYLNEIAKFPPPIWNVYETTLNMESRTNNYSESNNKRINYIVDRISPNIYELNNSLKNSPKYLKNSRTRSK